MHRSSKHGASRLILVLGSVLGLATTSHAFTLFEHPVIKITGPAAADFKSQTATRPRYSVSHDGCRGVFTSFATKLVPGQSDGNDRLDVFLFDLCNEPALTLVSHTGSDTLKTANGTSDQPVISADGRFVVFRSTANDIVPERDPTPPADYNDQTNIFMWSSGTFWLVSHRQGDDQEPANGPSLNAVINSGTGQRYVAFESSADNLVSLQAPGLSEIYRWALGSGPAPVTLVSVPNLGLPYDPLIANGSSSNPAISGEGNCIVYESQATNLVSDKTTDDVNQDKPDVFRWFDPRVTILLSHRAGAPNIGNGAFTGDGESTEPSISDDCLPPENRGQFAFKSVAKDLHGDTAPTQIDGNGGADVFVAENTGNSVLVSHRAGAPDEAGSHPSDAPILSRDGAWVAYASLAVDVAGQTDPGPTATSDVFLYNIRDNKSVLVSHAADNDSHVAGAESFAPEISKDGLYVAYESDAKDIDPNQNDGNGLRDVFLYNARWNNSVLASRRFASIAITGNRQSDRPALSGDGYTVAFTGGSDDLVPEDPEVGGLDDVFVFLSWAPFPGFVPSMSVRSTDSTNTLQWVTPSVDYVSMEMLITSVTPCDDLERSNAAWSSLPGAPTQPRANTSVLFEDLASYVSPATRCYGIFIERDYFPIQGTDTPFLSSVVARTIEDPTGKVKWASNLSGVSALTQVGIGLNLVAVTNNGVVAPLTKGPLLGGFWPSSSRPFRAPFFDTIQGRPAVVPFSVQGSTRTTFVGSQLDGRAYAVNADVAAGVGAGGAYWYTPPLSSDGIQSGLGGMFTMFSGGLGNHLLFGTRSLDFPNPAAAFFALNAATGKPRVGSPFTGAGSFIGGINNTASVDYTLGRVYFASTEYNAGEPSLWCLRLDSDGFAPGLPCWTQTLPVAIKGGPVQRADKVYVGDDLGQVWAFDAASGNFRWQFASCGGGRPIKSYVLADRQGTDQGLYYATGSIVPAVPALCAIRDAGGSANLKWGIPFSTIPDPSAPILARIGGRAYIYVGSSNGRLYQIEADNPAAIESVLVRTGAVIGAPSFDVTDNMVYVGTEAGVIYAVQAPLP